MEPMLASRGNPDDIVRWQSAGWMFDLKIDGIRCRAFVAEGEVRLRTRADVNVTADYPEIVAALAAAYPCEDVTLDGEIAVLGPNGFPSWPLTHKRNAQQSRPAYWARTLPATFFAFDMLLCGSEDMTSWTYTTRRERLNEEATRWSPPLVTTPNSPDGEALWRMVTEHQLEGVIAKRPGSRYRGGYSADWVKIKRTSTISCLVGGYDPGKGHRASTFGALHLYLLDAENNLVPVGKVGSGFSDAEATEVMHRLHQTLIVEVSFLDRSPDGMLRQPVFQRFRDDLDVTGCTLSQLD